MAFPNFGSLPLEIREQIWLFSLPADEPEVCLMWPVYLHQRFEGPESTIPSSPFVVDTAFPGLMHVCRESRTLVQNSHISGVRFRSSASAGCPVPFRRFCPELDTMYLGSENIIDVGRNAYDIPGLDQVTSLAIELQWGFRYDHDVTGAILNVMNRLQTLSIVLPDSSDNNWPRQVGHGHEAFKQPARRCKLQRIDPELQPTIHVDTTGDDWATPMALVSLPLALSQCRQALENNALLSLEEDALLSRTTRPDREDRKLFDHLAINAQTFIEYQKDGSWKEICGERRFIDAGRHNMMGRYIPVAERPNPELVRVNDLDGEFEEIYVGYCDNGQW